MIKVGLLSDTHGYLDTQIYDYFSDRDEIWHAGDIGSDQIIEKLQSIAPLRAVFGNIDGQSIRKQYPKHLHWNEEGLGFWMTHIGGSIGKYPAKIREELNQKKPDIFICGHSHILQVGRSKDHNNMIHVNPGAAGKQGSQQQRTCVRFDLDDQSIDNMEVIHL